jgi:hypothetical protein
MDDTRAFDGVDVELAAGGCGFVRGVQVVIVEDEWKTELESNSEFFDKLGDTMPDRKC